MRPTFLLAATAALLGACATTSKSGEGGSGYCALGDVPWPSAATSFDRRLTLEVIGGLRQSVEADTRALHEGRRRDVGDRFTAIAHATTSAFISDGVHELALRLRQLDCAVRADKLPFEVAVQRYNTILGELLRRAGRPRAEERRHQHARYRRAVAPSDTRAPDERMVRAMSGSLKDALEKSGHAAPAEKAAPPAKPAKEWLHELPEDDGKPHVPFDAPALTKPKPSSKK